MKGNQLGGSINVDLEKLAGITNMALPLFTAAFALAGNFQSFFFHFLTVPFLLLTLVNVYYLKVQKHHTLLSNFGIIAQLRYIFESVGPEFRQYLFLSDVEERPFNRVERSEVYRKAKGVDSSSCFGSQLSFDSTEFKLRHSMFPKPKEQLEKFSLVFGEERGIENTYNLESPIIISAMSYGALGNRAVRALARGARLAGIPMNTGEGGYPKYHLMEDGDLIFQIGTAKFGVRREDGSLDEDKLKEIAQMKQIKMIEIKFSQGAKPGKGGMLPKEKITEEISKLRGVPMGKDVISPPCHAECSTPRKALEFIKKIQDLTELPVGIKFCLGREIEFANFVDLMKSTDIYPDYISIDGSEGGTGAAPKAFMDDVGVPIFKALPFVDKLLKDKGVRNRLKLLAAGKLVSPGKQFMALALGADAIYTARGFMLALGCIQALQCNKNTCPVGITSHLDHLQSGLDIEMKAQRVQQYVSSLEHDHEELLASLGIKSLKLLDRKHLYKEGEH